MSDSTSERNCGTIFEFLAKNLTKDNIELAKKLWVLTYNYNFSHNQMNCDNALIKLGLAKRGIDIINDKIKEKIFYVNSDFEFEI